jgi:hypothetical protein
MLGYLNFEADEGKYSAGDATSDCVEWKGKQ